MEPAADPSSSRKATNRPDDVEDELDPLSYQTRTRGTRQQQAARPAGEDVYALIVHDSHTHLAHALELPEKPGPVQAELNITTRASLAIAVRDPDSPTIPTRSRPGSPAGGSPTSTRRTSSTTPARNWC